MATCVGLGVRVERGRRRADGEDEPIKLPGGGVPTLEEVRLRRRLTQRALAARSGVSLSTIQAIEAGRSARVRFATMEKLADALGVEPEAVDDFAPSFRPRRRGRGKAGSDPQSRV
jgi:DNA-binding Xre family transcriptional regulator